MLNKDALFSRFPALQRLTRLPLPLLLAGGAALAAGLVVLLLWSRAPAYKVLFADLDDREGGAIVAALTTLNVPYRFSDNGGAILVPASSVHEARLALAGQGLPHSGNVGFELLDKTKFGASEFTEQLSYQRALEGELGNSIQSIHVVQRARVHLALPRESLFLRDRQPPSASVLVTLYPGRSLNDAQVAAIAWLVASSVPKLQADKVSVVDQHGRMLSKNGSQLDAHHDHQSLLHEVEAHTERRILNVLVPLVGAANVRTQVSAELDFSQREQTAEVYRPNQEPGQAAIRSLQTHDAVQAAGARAAGIPGALSNQPPGPVKAPIANAAAGGKGNGNDAAVTAQATMPQQHDSTTNFEVDRTIRHQKEMPGTIKRLSVAVVLNNVQEMSQTRSATRPESEDEQDDDKDTGEEKPNEKTAQPLSAEKLAELTRLVKDAMGYSDARGDSVSIVNSPFAPEPVNEISFWKDPDNRDLALQIGRWLLYLVACGWLWLSVLRPWLRQMKNAASPDVRQSGQGTFNATVGGRTAADAAGQSTTEQQKAELVRHEENLEHARKLATKDPRAVAMVMRTWMEKNDATS